MTFAELGWDAWITIGVVVAVLGLLVFTRYSADVVFVGGLSILLISGVLDADAALAGFSSPGMITVGVLYVVVAGLQETGGLAWISHHVLGFPKGSRRALLRMLLPVIPLSAFLNNTPVVAMFIPVVGEWCRRLRISPSKLLIPLSYASIFGGTCTLIGTSTNLVVNTLYQGRFDDIGLSMFEITKIGIPCALAGVGYLLLFSHRLLPERRTIDEFFENPREYTLELVVSDKSPLAGSSIEKSGLRQLPGGFLAELIRSDGQIISAVSPSEILEVGDRLVFVGNIESMRSLYSQQGLQPAPEQLFKLDTPRHQRCLVEAVVSHTCPLVGKTIRQGRFRNVYNAVVIAVARNGERLHGKIGDIRIRAGDLLLIESHAGFIPRQKDSHDFYLISGVENSTPRRFERAPWAFFILAGMVVAVAGGWLSMLQSALLAAGAMVLFRCCSTAQARRSIEWNVLIVIGAALGLGCALEQTGAAGAIAGSLLGLVKDEPHMALAMVYLATTFFTEIITNNAAAVLVFPIAMSTAQGLDVNPMPFVISIMIAASASFATPIGYQTNLMVYGPGGYRFSDYLRIGIPLNLIFGIVTVMFAPLIWPF
ncbi:MAG: SLC13 family permease [Pontiellaceae bacterium]|nr:SLC13 family permease [Pontiellaceae bacterium]MBN2784518.1 SLC13 family permease [Pontiellaceae bacterium]